MAKAKRTAKAATERPRRDLPAEPVPPVGGAEPVGRRLRALRKAKGLTLARTAPRVGCSIGHLSQIERGLSDPALALLTRLARVLGVPLSWFFSDVADAPPDERDHVVRRGARRRLELR
ncbi:MAG: helix-turn-helix transcriptional regulator, partial [Rhodobacterales bacterium]|nr:helix-turn-helix transcriptional regulator [Rhodobacterales bacterium]